MSLHGHLNVLSCCRSVDSSLAGFFQAAPLYSNLDSPRLMHINTPLAPSPRYFLPRAPAFSQYEALLSEQKEMYDGETGRALREQEKELSADFVEKYGEQLRVHLEHQVRVEHGQQQHLLVLFMSAWPSVHGETVTPTVEHTPHLPDWHEPNQPTHATRGLESVVATIFAMVTFFRPTILAAVASHALVPQD